MCVYKRVYSLETVLNTSILGDSVCVFGVFDGLHRGHAHIIETASAQAKKANKPLFVLTFDVDPDETFSSNTKKIMGNDQRIETLCNFPGVYGVVVIPFTQDFSELSPDSFLNMLFAGNELKPNVPASIHVGSDFRFGRGASGDVADLEAWGDAHSMRVYAHKLLMNDGAPITSTRIRSLLGRGNIENANALLGHPYTACSAVFPGRQAGRQFGIRTANMNIPDSESVLCDGVYAGYVPLDGAIYKAAISLGIPPTFKDEAKANLEVHILDLGSDVDLYGQKICVEFTHRIRDMRVFDSTDDLISTITSDIDWVRNNL